MITGVVNAHREAIVRCSILDSNGQAFEFDSVLDTGFNGSLTLPIGIITALRLPWISRGSATLANGVDEECDIYAGVVIWDGVRMNVLVEAAETDPLLGMRLMYGYRIVIEDIDGGPVLLERM